MISQKSGDLIQALIVGSFRFQSLGLAGRHEFRDLQMGTNNSLVPNELVRRYAGFVELLI
jgi:hypothetical protein